MSRRERMAGLGWTVSGKSEEPFSVLVTAGENGDEEPMLAGDRLVRYDHPFRAIDLLTGEPVEPGISGDAVAPRDGLYRVEVLCRHGGRDRPCASYP